jgi:hypothetical protein
MELNLIWLVKTQLEVQFSFEWICEVFSSYEVNHIYDLENKYDNVLNNSVLIVCVGKSPNERLIDYIHQYNQKNLNYTILHLSDEAFEQNIDFYQHSNKIIRNYYNKSYVDRYSKIFTLPLGYQTRIKNLNLDRSIDVNFVGQVKSDRHEMLSVFSSVEKKYFYLTRMWGDPNGLNVEQFSQVLSSSKYTLCPRGWISLDSFRLNEALECGSIPVSILDYDGSDYFYKIYGEHPFIIGKDWQDAYHRMTTCDRDLKLLEINKWWIDFKQNLKNKIKKYIDG